MIAKIKAFLSTLWSQHIQKTLAMVLGGLAVVDMTPYEADFHDLLPWKHWHAALRLVGAVAIFWRAMMAK